MGRTVGQAVGSVSEEFFARYGRAWADRDPDAIVAMEDGEHARDRPLRVRAGHLAEIRVDRLKVCGAAPAA